MSRNFIPAALAIGMGILTGYYTFQPALQEIQIEKRKPQSYVPLFHPLRRATAHCVRHELASNEASDPGVELGDQAIGPGQVALSEKPDKGGIEDRRFPHAQGLRTGSTVLKHVRETWCKTSLPCDSTPERAFEGPRAAQS
ncbi:hypothetical protein CFD26_107809 [Aspergillus turcosus]|uniref:Uncharacterized protein n=1 Tax=Aspergillus turcosus TaxID=1245748 RepID=A0A3R7GCB9_9EURO|nr:hypothetical protein CFD26_107809 [Aspergillus turcosus]